MITVIGLDGSPLSRQAAEAVASATLLVGGRRHLAAVGVAAEDVAAAGVAAAGVAAAGVAAEGVAAEEPARVSATRPDVVVMGPVRPALDALAEHDGDAVVLASGDPGFFGIVRALRERGLGCEVLPATSSVALAFARAGLAWDDAVVVSAHGRELRAAVNVCRAYPKVAVLTGPGQGPAEIGAALTGWPRRLLVAEDLGGADERITECTPAGSAARTWTDPNVVLALACPAPPPPPACA
jgi:precorrin-6Y C5,15-methyltransferase (decarboxylating)